MEKWFEEIMIVSGRLRAKKVSALLWSDRAEVPIIYWLTFLHINPGAFT